MLSTVIVGINIPSQYSRHLPHIVARAKGILAKRKHPEIEHAVILAESLIHDFMARLKEQHKGNYRRHAETELRIRHDLDILKMALKSYDYSGDEGFLNGTEAELCAALALSQVANALEIMSFSTSDITDQSVLVSFHMERLREFHDSEVVALEAVTFAENMAEIEKIHIHVRHLEAENNSLKNLTETKVSAEAKRVISKNARQAAIISHESDYAIQKQVYDWLEKQCRAKPEFINRSNSKIAGEIYQLDIFKREYDTLTKYVSEFKKGRNKAA